MNSNISQHYSEEQALDDVLSYDGGETSKDDDLFFDEAATLYARDEKLYDPDLEHLNRLASALDNRFRLPGTQIRFGWDTILGLVPGVGDTVTLAPAAWMIWRGHKRGVRKRALAKMMTNTGLDYVIGLIPLIGDIFDVGFKSNLKNIDIMRAEIQAQKKA